MHEFNPNKLVEYVDYDGICWPARIICMDKKANNDLTIIALVEQMDKTEIIKAFNKNGFGPSGKLRNIKVKNKGWIRVYPGTEIFTTEELARTQPLTEDFAEKFFVARITWEGLADVPSLDEEIT